MNDARAWLVAAGWMSVAASMLHLACIVGGPDWYRFLGAGEDMARGAERGALFPILITLAIAAILAIWAAYAFSAAGMIVRLPLIRTALVLISATLLIRATVLPLMPVGRSDLSAAFLCWSSAIVLVYGLTFAIGTWKAWPSLSLRGAL